MTLRQLKTAHFLAFLVVFTATSVGAEMLRCTYGGMDKKLRLYHLGQTLMIELNRDLASAKVNDFSSNTEDEWWIARIVRENTKILAVQWRQGSKQQPIFGTVQLAFRLSLRKDKGTFILSGSDRGSGAAGGTAHGRCLATE